jgi:putative transposase
VPRWRRWSRAARSPPCTGSSAGASSICANGSGTHMSSASRSRRSAANCARWVTASCRRARAITPRRKARSRISKKFSVVLETIARDRGLDPTDIDVWFGDEARIGQKNKITPRWARRDSRPSAPSDQRTTSIYIFGAICPKEGKAVGLILPWCDTAMMNLHLAAISADITPGRHAALLLDQAGWHLSAQLAVPANITIVPLPPKCPELNAPENVWQFMREDWLSDRVFQDLDDLVDHCCYAWNQLARISHSDRPGGARSGGRSVVTGWGGC